MASPGETSVRPGLLTQSVVRLAAVSVGTVLAVVAGWSILARTGEPPRELRVSGSELVALDASGRTQWAHRFDGSELVPQVTRWKTFVDLNDDGREETLAAVQVRHMPSGQHSAALARFAPSGRLEWSTVPSDRITFREGDYGPPWVPADLAVYRSGGKRRIAWSVHQFTWWPGLLITLDAEGRRLGSFVNAGWIRSANPSPDGRYLLLAGITNSRQSYFFAVLDAADPTGRSPEPPGSATECVTCPDGDPLHYVVFPRTDVSRHQPFPAAGPSVITSQDGSVEVHVLSSEGPNIADTIFTFAPAADDAPYALRSVRFSDSYWEWHRRLEEDGKLHHRGEECSERRGLEVQRWTRAGGWTSLHVTVR